MRQKSLVAAITCVIIAGLCTASGHAQTVIAIPLTTATLTWTIPAADATHGAADSHIVTCGANSVTVPIGMVPNNSVLVSSIVPAPGVYNCTVHAQNVFGSSTTEAFPGFEAGYPPLSPTNPQIIVP
ncbi:MAG: hypothetical protein OEY77_00250 [Nitrospira sp.]|nr:hypothetical protein [Nitrospira sp.]